MGQDFIESIKVTKVINKQTIRYGQTFSMFLFFIIAFHFLIPYYM
jgi:hypothetical protein